MRLGILTGGGDCPGLNACIRAIVRTCLLNGAEPIGIKDGWTGLIEEDMFVMDINSVSDIIDRGGTILCTSRVNPVKDDGQFAKIKNSIKKWGIEGLIVIGGNGTLAAANEVAKRGINIVGIPKTIDRDVKGTEDTIGFDTAVNIVTEAIDRLHSTAESHHRTIVMEVMGRNSGWVAISGGIAGAADCIIIPEEKTTLDEIERIIKSKYDRGKKFAIIVLAEGAHIEGVSKKYVGMNLCKELQRKLGVESRFVDLGHVQRGGKPTAFDRILATRMGVRAVDEAIKGNYGIMIGTKSSDLVTVRLENAAGEYEKDNKIEHYYTVARVFFG